MISLTMPNADLGRSLADDATIHLDPVAAEDEQTQMLHERMEAALFEINSGLTMHDFRIVPGPTHTNLIFRCCCAV